MKIYVTQLVYLIKGKEGLFYDFESKVIPLISRHSGKMVLRLKVDESNAIESSGALPNEIHFVEFESEESFKSYSTDEERLKYIHLKEQSVSSSLNILGKAV